MYEQKTFLDKVRSFDVYRKTPKGYLQSSLIGALCNII